VFLFLVSSGCFRVVRRLHAEFFLKFQALHDAERGGGGEAAPGLAKRRDISRNLA